MQGSNSTSVQPGHYTKTTACSFQVVHDVQLCCLLTWHFCLVGFCGGGGFLRQQQSNNYLHFTLILENLGKNHLTKVLMLFPYVPVASHFTRFKNTLCPKLAISGCFPQGDLCCCKVLLKVTMCNRLRQPWRKTRR